MPVRQGSQEAMLQLFFFTCAGALLLPCSLPGPAPIGQCMGWCEVWTRQASRINYYQVYRLVSLARARLLHKLEVAGLLLPMLQPTSERAQSSFHTT